MRKIVYSVLGVVIMVAIGIAVFQTKTSEDTITESNDYIYANKSELESIIVEEIESLTDEYESFSENHTIQGTLSLGGNSNVQFEESSIDYAQIAEQIREDSDFAEIRYDSAFYTDISLLHDTVGSVYMYSKQTGDILNSLVTQLANVHDTEASVYAIINESDNPEIDGYDFILMNEETKETYKVIYYYDCNDMCGYIVE